MSDNGFYKMYRGWMDHDVFEDVPYSDREAWEWLIAEARWEDGIMAAPSGAPVMVKRGEVYASIRFMAYKFKWSKDRVTRFLVRLEAWTLVRTATRTGQKLITICNYSRYQGDKDAPKDAVEDALEDSVEDTPKDKQEEIQRTKEKKAAELLIYDNVVIKFTEKDWRVLRKKLELTDEQLAQLMDDRDSFLASLPAEDPRRARWWMPTMRWLEGEVEGMRKSGAIE